MITGLTIALLCVAAGCYAMKNGEDATGRTKVRKKYIVLLYIAILALAIMSVLLKAKKARLEAPQYTEEDIQRAIQEMNQQKGANSERATSQARPINTNISER